MRGYSPRACWSVLALALIGCALRLPATQPHPAMLFHGTAVTELVAQPSHSESGRAVPASELPWKQDPEFHAAMRRSQTPLLMAAFRTELGESVAHETHNIALAAERLTGLIIPGGSVFSLNQTVGPYSEAKGFRLGQNYVGGRVILDVGGGVCRIATMLYNLTILSNLPVVQRKPHTMVVPYVPPGQDATVSLTAGVDYRFHNNTPGPILIWARIVGDTLYMAFYGQQETPTVKWRHQILSHNPASTVRRHNPELGPGEERQLSPGYDGYRVRSWAEITYANGQTKTRHLGVSHYVVSPKIIEHGDPKPAL
jgi:vancomycin resistance protein VanW